ncbi:MAG: hypothetical protein H6918_11275 [Sphingomonadaceae bacterium]|nr:hypothetical protein [Sphingomonadaceae bacterium]
MRKLSKYLSIVFLAMTLTISQAHANGVVLLLFDGKTGKVFAGCLNCSRYDEKSVCNRYGDYGSRYSEKSFWNRYGDFGSRYESTSPWNRYGEGLRILDGDGNYYGRFSLARYGQSKLPIIQALLKAYEANDDLSSLRDRYCEP